jgi:hypothetical protein
VRAPAVAPPLIVRVAGLPAEVLDGFCHAPLLAVLDERERLQKQLDEKRAALVDRLHEAIPKRGSGERRFLLAVKRRCFNGGSLKPYQGDPFWSVLAGVAGPLAEAIVALEEAAVAVEGGLEESYRRALGQERRDLVRLAGDRAFIRGVALASPVAAQNLDLLEGRAVDDFGRREKRLCLTLLRYSCRAALKLSPFSTLTRTGLGSANGLGPGGLALASGGRWEERSTACLRRELLAQCSILLLRYPKLAGDLPVRLNETVAHEGGGRYSFFRPARWEFDDESRSFRYADASFTRVKLEGPLISWLLAELRDGPQVYRHLLDRARVSLDPEMSDLIEDGVSQLLALGFVHLVPPWDFDAPDLERQILDHLDARPDDSALDACREALREVMHALQNYPGAVSPARFLQELKNRVEQLFHALAPPAGLTPPVEFQAGNSNFEEIVFLRPDSRNGTREIGLLSRDRLLDLVEELDPLVRLTHLRSSVHDLLHTLAAFIRRRWPGATEVGLLELFSAAQPVFDQYLRHRERLLRGPVSQAPGFNPLGLPAIESLSGWRQRVERELGACFRDGEEGQRLDPRALSDLLDQVPSPYARSRHFCAFLQPLDPEGERWILNALAEGYGRYGSRFTPGMDEDTREHWTSCFIERSILDLDGEPVEVVDMPCPGVRTINLHATQTRRVLKMPGEASALPPERVLRLHDLRVRLRGADDFPVLTDAAGQRLLPVQFGSLAPRLRPMLLKLLSVFGPGEFELRHPVRAPRVGDGVEVLDRHVLGRIVYVRRRWRFQPQPLLSAIQGQDEVRAFATIHRWRLANELPERVYARERTTGPGSRPKPQYIDFSSPSFLEIFKSILRQEEVLVLEEALPGPERFPVRNGRWGVEIQLETFGLEPPRVSSPRDRRGSSTTARPAGLSERSSLHEEEDPHHHQRAGRPAHFR